MTPSRCYNCALEALPEARFCGHCGVSLDVPRCTSCSGLVPVTARFCGHCGAAQAGEARAELNPDADEELRTVTIVFALIDGVPALLEEQDPEEIKDLLDDVFRMLAQQVEEHGGVIDKIMADSIMALFGVPKAREEDAQRAVAATLGMIRSVEALNRQIFRSKGLRLSLKVGVNTGKVVAGFVGEGDERAFTVLGDAVNIASRLEHAAPPGGALIADTTRRLLSGRFRLRAWPPLSVKGRAEPLPAFQVIGEADSSPMATVDLSTPAPLVGRAGELDQLIGLWRDVEHQGAVRWVTVVGELGQGKRRLLDEFVRVATQGNRRAQLIRVQGTPSLRGEASDLMRVFVESLRRVRIGEGYTADWERLLEQASQALARPARQVGRNAMLPGDRHQDPGTGARRYGPLIHLVADLASEGPLLIVFDALHDADDLTLDFVEDLASELPDCPVMLIGTSRPHLTTERRPGWGATSVRHTSLEMGSLGPAEARQLMAWLTGGLKGLPDGWVDQVYTFTGGNPYYITETVKELIESRSLGGNGEARPLPVPESIEAVIQSRLDRLSFEESLTLRAAAVVGDVFWAGAINAMLGSDRTSSLERLVEGRFIRALPQGGIRGHAAFAFSHRLLSKVAYENLLSEVKRRYHLSCAQWLIDATRRNQGGYHTLIAHHLESGRSDREAAERWVEAAELAIADYRFGEAQHLLERSQGCLARHGHAARPVAARLALAQGQAHRGLGHLSDARASFLTAAQIWAELAEETRAARAHLMAGWAALVAGDYDAVAQAIDAAEDLEPLPPDVRGNALHLGAELLLFTGSDTPVEAVLERAQALMERGEDPLGVAAVINSRGKFHDSRSRLDAAREAFADAVRRREALRDIPGLASSLNNLGSVLEALGDLKGAEACHTRSLTVRRRLEDRWGVGATLLNQVSVLLHRGYLG